MNTKHLRDKFRGALLGAAIGDALGAVWPLLDEQTSGELSVLERPADGLTSTGVTHLTAAVATSLVERWGLDLQHVRTIAAGYAADAARSSVASTNPLLVMPVSLLAYHDLEMVAWLAQEAGTAAGAGETTFEGGVLFACAVALLFQQPPADSFQPGAFLDALAQHTAGTSAGAIVREIREAASGQGMDGLRRLAEGAQGGTVQAALCAFLVACAEPHRVQTPRQPCLFVAVLRYALTLGGDRAILSALAGTLAGAHGGEQAIPITWREQIPEARQLLQLADALLDMAAIGPTFRDLSYYMAGPELRSLTYHVAGWESALSM